MAVASALSLDGGSSDYEDSISSGHSFDSLDELLSRFTLDFRPEYILKFRNRLGPLVLGVDASHLPDTRITSGALVLKPVSRDAWWRRLHISTTGNVTLRSRKLRWWVFTLNLEGSANVIHHTTAASFRVATKWDLSRGEYRNKRKMKLGDATEGRVHWHVNYNLPEVAGSFGADSRDVSQGMHAEVGYAHAEVSKMELVVWPWRNNPKTQLISGGGGGGMSSSRSIDEIEGKEADGVVAVDGVVGRKKDWVAQGLSDLQQYIGELQEWWEEKY